MYQKSILENGHTVISNRMTGTRSVSVCVFVGAGSRYEEDAQAGISHFLEHMVFKGTNRRPSSAEISGSVEEVGGIMNGGTDRELTIYWCKVAQKHFPKALDVLMDMVCDPLLIFEQVEKERSVVQEELSMANDSPSSRADILLDEMLWPNQAMGRDVGGSKESVQGITRDMLYDFFHQQYVASNIVVSVAGDISHEEVVKAVCSVNINGPSGGTPMTSFPAAHADFRGPSIVLEYRRTEQANLCLALPGIPTRHRDRYASDLLSAVLGEGMSSRLFLEVREKRGLTYDIHTSASHYRDTGSFGVYFGVDPKKAKHALEIILYELERIKDGIPEQELNRARELTKGRLLLRMEDTRAVAGWAGSQDLLYKDVVSVDDVVEKLDTITIKDVQRVANELLVPSRLKLSVVGPYRSSRQFEQVLKV